jgi:hypothetical protein
VGASQWLERAGMSLFVGLLRIKQISHAADVAGQVAADVPDDAEAVAAIKAAGGTAQDYRNAAELFRRNRYRYEHRDGRRAARLLTAAADGGLPVRASSEEEALFRAVDNLEAVPAEDRFAVLAAEVPALRELEDRIIGSRSAPGWEDRDADDRRHEISGSLGQLVGPQASDGSPLIRSAVAYQHARVHLLGIADLLLEDPESADPQEQEELLAALARGYGVKPELNRVARAIRRRVEDLNGFPTRAVLAGLLGVPGMGERLRSGDGLPDSSRKAMVQLLTANQYPAPAEFVDAVVAEVRSTLLQSRRSLAEQTLGADRHVAGVGDAVGRGDGDGRGCARDDVELVAGA